ncbi:DUF4376 domain-containing protein [Caulobacter segnis]|uniref:DUF4376 domain-containing protein n=1 Tax=Caulobacter segnis TaxID=88688 RepID=A0A2W5UXA0_9CAUL|nr:DUF4376 domain-containing protein [Caulobacter segnis]PZR32300.1 MAG: hypothetical protein DI526_17145 [Caulobacter segnis]
MPIIYELDAFGQWTGRSREIDETEGYAPSWTFAEPPPAIPAGQAAVWIAGGWVLRVQPLDALGPVRSAALAQLADMRWQATEFFTYDGVAAWADSALSAVIGFVVGAQIAPPDGPVSWKLAQGEFRSWSLAQVTAYGIAIRTHIQACFDVEADLTAQILAAESEQDITEILAAASAAWPT